MVLVQTSHIWGENEPSLAKLVRPKLHSRRLNSQKTARPHGAYNTIQPINVVAEKARFQFKNNYFT